MLDHSLLFAKAMPLQKSEYFSLEQICNFLSKENELRLDKRKVDSVLSQLSSPQYKFLHKSKELSTYGSSSSFAVNLSEILYQMRIEEIERLIAAKFPGNAHIRVFRALKALGYSSDAQLEQLCLLSLKEVRATLMELTQEGLLEMHELNINKGQYAYSIRVGKYTEKVIEILFKSKLNLLIKIDQLEGLKIGGEESKKFRERLLKMRVACAAVDEVVLVFTQF